MPYIVTPGVQTTDAGTNYESTAVETIEEARDKAGGIAQAQWTASEGIGWLPSHLARRARCLPESGGTIGPLPDGCIIDVQPITYDELAGLVFDRKDYAPMFESDIIDAYNDR